MPVSTWVSVPVVVAVVGPIWPDAAATVEFAELATAFFFFFFGFSVYKFVSNYAEAKKCFGADENVPHAKPILDGNCP